MQKIKGPDSISAQLAIGSRVNFVVHSHPDVEAVEIARWLPERLEKAVDQAVEMSVVSAEVLNLLDRVNHRRMMLPAEAASDLGERRMSK